MIGSWNRFHREHAVAAFEAGKDVFCEKPLATNLDDCVAMARAWKKSGRLFSIGFTLRYSPHYRKVRELIAEGTVGDVVSLEFNETLHFCHGGYIMGNWRRLTRNAGSHMLEKCCHDLDLANWMIGSRVQRVASFGGLRVFTPENAGFIDRIGKDDRGRTAYRTWPDLDPRNPFTSDKDIVDHQVAVLEYENGVRATFHANCHAAIPERRMYICGTHGAIRADVMSGVIQFQKIGFGEELQSIDPGASGGHGGGDDVLADSLAESMLNGAKPFTGLEDGLKSAVTAFAIDDAMESGEVVDVAPYWERVDSY